MKKKKADARAWLMKYGAESKAAGAWGTTRRTARARRREKCGEARGGGSSRAWPEMSRARSVRETRPAVLPLWQRSEEYHVRRIGKGAGRQRAGCAGGGGNSMRPNQWHGDNPCASASDDGDFAEAS